MILAHVFNRRKQWQRLSLLVILLILGSFGTDYALASSSRSKAYADAERFEDDFENTLAINELMAANNSTIADEDGSYEDWIEIHNWGNSIVSLQGIGLSDTPSQPFRWLFPNVQLAPGEFLLVWASGKDRAEPGQPLHTNFSISASGEAIVLTHPSAGTLDQIGPIPLTANLSYGRKPDGVGDLGFFPEPTPGASNSTPAYTEILVPPAFSVVGGFYTQPFSLTLTSSSPGTTIFYTLDGSEPDPVNVDGKTYTYKQSYPHQPGDPLGELLTGKFQTQIYRSPFSIVDRSGEANDLAGRLTTWNRSPDGHVPDQPVFKGTMVRARTVKEGALSSPIVTHTYFISPDAPERYKLPVISLAVQEDLLFDYDIGVYTAGVDFDTWRAAHPDAIVDEGTPANYSRRGETWEYPVHFELFDQNANRSVDQRLGFRIHGGWSRGYPQKSFRLYASTDYDNRNVLDYPIFTGLTDRVSGQPITTFRRLLLRNSGNDNLYTRLRDPFIQTLLQSLGVDGQAYRPAIHFINGEYWGLINIRERLDRFYIASHYGIDPDDVALLEDNASLEEGTAEDRTDFLALRSYIGMNDMSDPVHFAYAAQRMDMDNFILYHVGEIYAANVDWPHQNITYWRKRTPDTNPGAPTWHDGRWRWLLNDLDHGFGLINNTHHNTLSWATRHSGSSDWSTVMLRSLLKNPGFREKFINAMADHMNTTFQPAHVEAVLNTLQTAIQPYLDEHVQRWPDTVNTSTASILNFAQQRPAVMRQHLIEYFGLVGTAEITLNTLDPEQGFLRINTIEIDHKQTLLSQSQRSIQWKGIYYRDVSIRVTAVARPGYRFRGWAEYPDQQSASFELLPADGLTLTPLFEPQALLHYWNFNEPDQILTPSFTRGFASLTVDLGSATEITHATGGDFVGVNARMGSAPGTHLRINEPLGATLTFRLPTTGYEDIVIKYESRRSGQGAAIQEISYTTDGLTYTPFETVAVFDASPIVYTLDFSQISAIDQNADFALRITFLQGTGGTAGNNRFDNMTVEGSSRLFLPVIHR
jgi:hypothetical protein